MAMHKFIGSADAAGHQNWYLGSWDTRPRTWSLGLGAWVWSLGLGAEGLAIGLWAQLYLYSTFDTNVSENQEKSGARTWGPEPGAGGLEP